MNELTMLYKQHRIQKVEVHKAISSAKHHLLLDHPAKRKQQRISERSKYNVYKFNGKVMTTEEERKNALAYIESLFNNDNKQFNFPSYRKVKFKIKKWIGSDKTSVLEKKFFNEMLSAVDTHQSKPWEVNSLISRCSKFENVSRFNDKVRALTTLCNLQNERIRLKIDHGSQLSCALVDIILKIPKGNIHDLTAEEQAEILTSYYEKNFPQFPALLVILHKDEIIHHVHLMIDAKNQNTNEYDYVQTQYLYIKNKYGLQHASRYSKCTSEQLTQIGELLQTDFYEHINNAQQKYIFKKKEYETPELKKLARAKIALDTNKPIADREYNTANYLKKLIRKYETTIGELKKDKEKLLSYKQAANAELEESKITAAAMLQDYETLLQKNESLTHEYKSLQEKVSQLQTTVPKLVEEIMLHAATFANSLLDSDYSPFKQNIRTVHDADEGLAIKTLYQAILIQPSPDKKQAMKDSFDDAFGRSINRRQ
jgi:hypothetical protein